MESLSCLLRNAKVVYVCMYVYVQHTGLSDCSGTKNCLVWGWLLASLAWRGFSGHKPLCLSGHSPPSVGRGQKGVMSVFTLVVVVLQKNFKISILSDR